MFQDTDELADGDTDTELQNKQSGSESTADDDWTTSHNNTDGTSTLETTEEVRFTDLPAETYTQAAVQNDANVDEFVIKPFDTGETLEEGDELFFSAGDLEFTLGGE